ncbi:MAG: flagellar motor protein MotB [Planctomycetota bacterium]
MPVEVHEEPRPGVPAFMATFADLMTLLLVFFILLNVYANEKQHGLLSAMTGSITAAFYSELGEGGLLSGAKEPEERNEPRAEFAFVEEGEGEPAQARRSGEEVELGRSSAAEHTVEQELRIASPFSFAHGSAELGREARRSLDLFARKYGTPDITVRIDVKAGFVESFQPMELGYRRLAAILGYLEAVGVSSELVPTAAVVPAPGGPVHGGDAPYRSVDVTVLRRR